MTNIIGILKKANSSTLALIDELGAGTDPVEGAALAIAILEKLRARGAKIASTTHYAELKEFALRTDGIENGSCEFDIKTLRPTYKLLIGVPGKSNAFAISRRLGMDENLVIRAQELVSGDSRQFEDVVTKLESRRQSLEKQLENAQRLTQKANTEKQKAENELQKAKQKAEVEIEKARAEAERIVSRTKAQAYALMDEMEKAKKEQDNSKSRASLRRAINKIEDRSNPVENRKEQEDYKLPRPLKVGDNVLIYDIDKDAVVLELPDKDDMVMVQAGIIKTRVKLSNLRLKKSEAKKVPTYKNRNRNISSNVDIRPSTEVDVRGQTAIEAIMAVDSAIDNAILSNIETLTIIHGKGTGVLRKEIQKHLRTVKFVKSFRLGNFGEGESGVTIVTLK
jgi:DNA mismatch repair protein MutS2